MSIRNRPPTIPLSPLAGREAELQTLGQLWRSSRLVTLFGQSGVGKSALAQAAAAELSRERPDRVRVLDAQEAAGGAAVLRLLARVRRRSAGGPVGDGAGAAADGSSPVFVLLDHLPVAAHAATRGLLQWLVVHPEVHLLVVSRRPLALIGEQAMPLAPLPVAAGEGPAAAVAALVEHWSRGMLPEGSAMEPAAVRALCEALDGLPAALEAAVGLRGVLPDTEIVRLTREEPLELSLRGTPVRALLAATWADLPAAAQEYLAANAGWPAGFTDEAGAQLGGAASAGAVLPLLIRMGLLRVTRRDPPMAYRLSPLLRAWLVETGIAGTPERRERLARYLLSWAGTLGSERGVGTPAPPPPAEKLAAVRWAWRWLAGQREGAAVRQLVRALAAPLCHEWGEPAEARELLRSAVLAGRAAGDPERLADEVLLAAVEVLLGRLGPAEARLRRLLAGELTPLARAEALRARAMVAACRGRDTAALEDCRAAVALLRMEAALPGRAEALGALAGALHGLALEQRRQGHPEAARRALEECGALFTELECPFGRAAVLAAVGALHADRGDVEEARWHARESRALAEQSGDRPGRARALQLAGRIEGAAAPEAARRLLDEAISLWREMQRPADLAAALLDWAALPACPPEGALDAARAARQLAREHGLSALESAADRTLADIARRSGSAEPAAPVAAPALPSPTSTVPRRDPPLTPSSSRPLSSSPRPTPAGPLLLVRLLGPFTVEGPGGLLAAARLRPKEQRILARLALDGGRLVARDSILELFWPESPTAAAERSLRTVVSSLRAALRPVLAGDELRVISGRQDGYCLEGEACAVDIDRFAKAVRAARSVPSEAPLEVALARWREAYEWYRGDLLGMFQYEDWCLTARERLRNEFLEVLFRLAQGALRQGDPGAALGLADRMVEIDATEERAHRLLMRCYALLDRPAEALRQFERCRAALWDELAARPARSTVALLQAVRANAALAAEEEEEPELLHPADPALPF